MPDTPDCLERLPRESLIKVPARLGRVEQVNPSKAWRGQRGWIAQVALHDGDAVGHGTSARRSGERARHTHVVSRVEQRGDSRPPM